MVWSPFAAGVLVTDKVLAVLVDGVVGEMHAHVILKGGRRGRETSRKKQKQLFTDLHSSSATIL